MQNCRTIEVLGTIVQVPDELETLRLSIGVQAIIDTTTLDGLPASVLLINRNRLKKGDPQFSLPGGAAELIDSEIAKTLMARDFGIRPSQFENCRDARITDVPIDITGQVVNALVEKIDFPREIARELREEFGQEMLELAAISDGKVRGSSYQGPLPKAEEINFERLKVFPVKTSGRSGSASLRVQAVYRVKPTQPLSEFIRGNSAPLNLGQETEVNTPMLVVPQAAVASLIELLNQSTGESAQLPDVRLAGTKTPVSIASLVRLLE